MLSTVCLNGETISTTFTVALNGERFKGYLRDSLVPKLKDEDIVIMDNLSSHKVERIKELIESAGVSVPHLPPYSPDLNPIEQMWSKIKAMLRAFKPCTLDALFDDITKKAFTLLTTIFWSF